MPNRKAKDRKWKKRKLNEKLKKEGRTVCFKCRCVQKFVKNGGNTSLTRQGIAIDHLMNKGNLIDKVTGL